VFVCLIDISAGMVMEDLEYYSGSSQESIFLRCVLGANKKKERTYNVTTKKVIILSFDSLIDA